MLNFEIMGDMDTKPSSEGQPMQQQTKASSFQNENIEPQKPESKANQSTTKSFYNKESQYNSNKESQVQSTGKLSTSSSCSSEKGSFNGFKVFGISSLNPYQNKYFF